MSILSRWRGRLRVRRQLEQTAKRRHRATQDALMDAREDDVHPRGHLVKQRDEASATLRKRRQQVAQAERVIARHLHDDSPREKGVRWGLRQVGVSEKPPGSNWGGPITEWIKKSGYGFPVPWCQCYANAVAVAGGAAQLRTGYTPTVMRGIGGYKPVPVSQALRGDHVFFKFPGVSRDSCDHVGVLLSMTANTVTCLEGNTSSGTSGSQNNGGGVYIRTRSRSLVAGAVRVPYPKD